MSVEFWLAVGLIASANGAYICVFLWARPRLRRWLDRRVSIWQARLEHDRKMAECVALSGATREQIIRHLSGVLYDPDSLIEGLKCGAVDARDIQRISRPT